MAVKIIMVCVMMFLSGRAVHRFIGDVNKKSNFIWSALEIISLAYLFISLS